MLFCQINWLQKSNDQHSDMSVFESTFSQASNLQKHQTDNGKRVESMDT